MSWSESERASLEKVYAKDPAVGRRRLHAMAGVTMFKAQQFLLEKRGVAKSRPQPPAQSQSATVSRPGSSISVKDFVGKFDYAGNLRRTISRVCRNSFVSEAVIRTESGIPPATFRLVSEQPEFKRCQIKDRDGTWWSMEKNTDLVRKEAQKWGVQR